MDYALGKQLKDAGFPQKEPNGFSGIIAHVEDVADDTVYYPTLDELNTLKSSPGFAGVAVEV
jgi:hypothetical protein